MRHPLSLSLELALKGRKEPADSRIYAPRPVGEVVWVHIGMADVAEMIGPLADRLLTIQPDLNLLVTTARDLQDPGLNDPRIIGAGSVPEHAQDAKAFIAHFAPDLGLWAGGGLIPAALAAAAESDVPMALIAALEDGVPQPGVRWRSSITGVLLKYFSAVYAETANAEKRLAGYGLDPDTLHLVGPMQVGLSPPPCNEEDLDALRTLLHGRRLWAAVHVAPDEIAKVLDAHKLAARFDPRALLILHPTNPKAGEIATSEIAERGLNSADWDMGEMPQEPTQVLIARDVGELGLWHRLTPVTLIGTSMSQTYGGKSPWAAAALGSAILTGTYVRDFRASYGRLYREGAARAVANVEELATALTQLSAPDRAAAMAHAGWSVSTAGAEATDRVIDLVQDTLETRGAP